MRQYLIYILILVAFSSCQTSNSFQNDTFQLLLPDTSKTHRANTDFDRLIKLSRQMGLPRIDTGVNGFEIRLWTSSMIDPDEMVVLRKVDSVVTAQKYNYNAGFDTVEHFKLMAKYQDTSITQLIDSIQQIDFTKMISQDEIEGFDDNMADGMTYHLEVSTPKYYKLLTYHCPDHFAKTEINNKKFMDIVLLLDKEFHIYSPICK
jgi:hypothetical protein